MNKLLIIDPQNDFTDIPFTDGETIIKQGSLSVPNAYKDYGHLVHLLTHIGDKIDEIHVSLDTHTEQHIGHPKFWKQTNGTDIPNSIYMLKFENDTVTGNNILAKLNVAADFPLITVVPKDDDLSLLKYVKEYIKWFDTEENTHGQRPFIWFQHCIEGTGGHKVNSTLKSALDNYTNKVTYHIKGQNNLAEMYSIFKAERPVSSENLSTLKKFVYTGVNDQEGSSSKTYEEVSKFKNLNTELNVDLLKKLLGEVGSQNTVYVCGEARTHCVKSSIIDLLEYVETHGYDQSKIIFIRDISSPIGGTPNDIVFKVSGEHDEADEKATGYALEAPEENHNDKENYKYLFSNNYKSYNGKVLTSIEIINMFKDVKVVNSVIAETRKPGYLSGTLQRTFGLTPEFMQKPVTSSINFLRGRKPGGKVSRRRHPKREGKRRSSRR
jgi:nicotinamidase-related amidase